MDCLESKSLLPIFYRTCLFRTPSNNGDPNGLFFTIFLNKFDFTFLLFNIFLVYTFTLWVTISIYIQLKFYDIMT